MNKGSIKYHICKILKVKGKPLNSHHIFIELENLGIDTTRKSLESMLSEDKAKFNRQRVECQCCGKSTVQYWLSEQGLIALAWVDRSNVELSLQEYRDLGIMVSEGA